MSPDRRPPREARSHRTKAPRAANRLAGDAREPWYIEYFRRYEADDAGRAVPAREFLDGCPSGVRADLVAIITAVADSPPPQFSGGGMWQVMSGEMKGFHYARAMGPGKHLYRVYCILEREAPGLKGPSIILIAGLDKPNETAFSEAEYDYVRALGNEYRARTPRHVLR